MGWEERGSKTDGCAKEKGSSLLLSQNMHACKRKALSFLRATEGRLFNFLHRSRLMHISSPINPFSLAHRMHPWSYTFRPAVEEPRQSIILCLEVGMTYRYHLCQTMLCKHHISHQITSCMHAGNNHVRARAITP